MFKRLWVIMRYLESFDWTRTEAVAVCHNETDARSIVDWFNRNNNDEGRDFRISYHYEVVEDVEDKEYFMEVYENDYD